MQKYLVATVGALAAVAVAGVANATLVDFTNAYTSHTFSDGSFSFDLSGGQAADGLFALSQHSAFNAYGQQGEYIRFNAPVRMDSLVIGKCLTCFDSHPATFTVNLYDASAVLIGSVEVTASSTEETVDLNVDGVSKVEFTFQGADGTNPYGDGRDVAWYQLRDISYQGGVPEPGVWALMICGFAFAGSALRRRRATAA